MKVTEKQLYELLKSIGMPLNVLGYKYIKYAVMLIVEDENYLDKIARLYPAIADKYGSNVSRVERAIRHAIEMTFEHIPGSAVNDIFGCWSLSSPQPTNKQFLAAIVEYIRFS